MSRSIKILILTAVVGLSNLAILPMEAEAGPLLDWFRGLRRPRLLNRSGCNTCGVRQQALAPTTAQFTGTANPAGLQPGQCMRTCNQTCSRTVVNYVPYTAYRTNWKRVPNTQYRPVTNSDPCTGCTVTCMKPCTTYSWQMERQPYTTYRPVYRQENYSVPVTTITNDCATGTCGTCPTGTCGTAISQPAIISSGQPTPALQGPAASTVPQLNQSSGFAPIDQNFNQPTFNQNQNFGSGTSNLGSGTSSLSVPSGTISTSGSYQVQPNFGGSGTQTIPANASPVLNSFPTGLNPQINQRPIIDGFPSTQTNGTNLDWDQVSQKQSDSKIDVAQIPIVRDRTAASPVRRQWSYSPIRLASHTAPVQAERASLQSPADLPVVKSKTRSMNSGWEPVKW